MTSPGIKSLCGPVYSTYFTPGTGAYKGVGGFKAMGSVFLLRLGLGIIFGRMTAIFSIILAFMNLLPIPALGWWACVVYFRRNDYRPQTKRKVPGVCTNCWYGYFTGVDAVCKRKRLVWMGEERLIYLYKTEYGIFSSLIKFDIFILDTSILIIQYQFSSLK